LKAGQQQTWRISSLVWRLPRAMIAMSISIFQSFGISTITTNVCDPSTALETPRVVELLEFDIPVCDNNIYLFLQSSEYVRPELWKC
jgi:hypothetical protein